VVAFTRASSQSDCENSGLKHQREVRGQFDGGSIKSDAGGLLLREVEKRTNIIVTTLKQIRGAIFRRSGISESA
jgi:hypothetical protein